MSIYYPIEFLPENPELGEPKNRNYLRNNLPYANTKTENNNNNNNSMVQYGKKETYLSSSINNTEPSTEFHAIANKTNLASNIDNKTDYKIGNYDGSFKVKLAVNNYEADVLSVAEVGGIVSFPFGLTTPLNASV
jgi:hypothetical protein